MGRLPLGLLQQFVLVARLGNLSRAATQANLTVSALSHQMKQLEERLERRLFERGPRGVTLTVEGCSLLEAVGELTAPPTEAVVAQDARAGADGAGRVRGHQASLTTTPAPGVGIRSEQ